MRGRHRILVSGGGGYAHGRDGFAAGTAISSIHFWRWKVAIGIVQPLWDGLEIMLQSIRSSGNARLWKELDGPTPALRKARSTPSQGPVANRIEMTPLNLTSSPNIFMDFNALFFLQIRLRHNLLSRGATVNMDLAEQLEDVLSQSQPIQLMIVQKTSSVYIYVGKEFD